MGLLVVVSFSYRQTIFAYPSGGGSYVVSKDNLGEKPALVAGASLLVDYVLTVAVSISAGVAAITSAAEGLRPYRVELCLAFIAVLALANLRGLKESGTVFAVPTYVYIVVARRAHRLGLLPDLQRRPRPAAAGDRALRRVHRRRVLGRDARRRHRSSCSCGRSRPAPSPSPASRRSPTACRRSSSRSHATRPTTLTAMAVILGVYFFCISVLAHRIQPTLSEDETILSLLGGAVFGDGSVMYYVLQFSTMAILLLAANTAFADFPRIASILARDGYLPRQLHNRGDRLVFSNGIIALAVVAALLIVVLRRRHHGADPALRRRRLLRVHAVAVRHGQAPPAAPASRAGSATPSSTASAPSPRCVVLLVVVVSKFTIGAWVPVVLIPCIAFVLTRVKRHYDRVARALRVPPGYRARRHTHTVVVLVGSVHRATLAALAYAKSLAPDRLVRPHRRQRARGGRGACRQQWAEYGIDVPLRVLASPYRELSGPVLAELDQLDAAARERHHHRRPPRVRAHAVVGAAAAQPVGADPQGPAAVPPQHRRRVGAVPHRPRRGRRARRDGSGRPVMSSARRRVEERRSTIRGLRALRSLLDDCRTAPDLEAAAVATVRSMLVALPLEDCWFEGPTVGPPLPVIRPDGDVDALVQRRGARGLALPGAVAVPAGDHGRFVLVGDPAVGLTAEERLVALGHGRRAVAGGRPQRLGQPLRRARPRDRRRPSPEVKPRRGEAAPARRRTGGGDSTHAAKPPPCARSRPEGGIAQAPPTCHR